MKFENKNLQKYVVIILNKNIDDIKLEELSSITCINISNVDSATGERAFSFNDLQYFPNISRIIISSSIITHEDIDSLNRYLPNLEDIEFQNCELVSETELTKLSRVKSLTLSHCLHKNIDFLKEYQLLESCIIEYPYSDMNIDMSVFENLKLIRDLHLIGCILTNQDCMSRYFERLEKLSLFDTELENLDFINSLKDGSTLYISPQYFSCKEIDINKQRLNIMSDYSDLAYE